MLETNLSFERFDLACYKFLVTSNWILSNFAGMKSRAYFHINPKSEPLDVDLNIDIEGLTFSGNRVILQKWRSDDLIIQKLQGADKWKIKHTSILEQSLLIDDKPLIDQIRKAFPASFSIKNSNPSVSSKHSITIFFALIVLFVLICLLFWKGTPLVADFVATSVPQQWEDELGEKLSKEVLTKEKVDLRKTALIQKFYNKLQPNEAVGEKKKSIEITVVQKDEFNAFAIPGRKIIVYSGAINRLSTYEELIALIGHEAGHVEGRHSMRTLFRSLSTYTLISIFVGDVSGIAGVIFQNMESIYALSYSRDFERESDKQSHAFLCLNHADENAILRLMMTMKRQIGLFENKDLAFLNSHPLTDERIENAKNEILKNGCRNSQKDPFLENIFSDLKK